MTLDTSEVAASLVDELFDASTSLVVICSDVDIDTAGYSNKVRRKHQKSLDEIWGAIFESEISKLRTILQRALDNDQPGLYCCEDRHGTLTVLETIYGKLKTLRRPDGYEHQRIGHGLVAVRIWVDR